MGIMTAIEIKNTTWDFTCKLCSVIRTALSIAFVGLIAFGESAGRARAASELSRQGFHDEAKALMTSPKDFR
tara:strand:- start:567 stop:782 length:216 start_codon:yes stop_codon:yes gene_type:complete